MSVCGGNAVDTGHCKNRVIGSVEISPFSFLAVSAPRPSGGSASIDDINSFEGIQKKQKCVGNGQKWARGEQRRDQIGKVPAKCKYEDRRWAGGDHAPRSS